MVLILADDLGWRDLGCYGHEIHETPNIDKLASVGMRFTNGYAACPICAPSRAAIMTGKFPSNTGFVDIAHSKPGSVIRAGDWKYLRFYEDGREELYNLKDDIGETNNLARSMPEKTVELKTQLDAVLKAHNATIPTAVPAKPSRPARKKTAKKAEKRTD